MVERLVKSSQGQGMPRVRKVTIYLYEKYTSFILLILKNGNLQSQEQGILGVWSLIFMLVYELI